MKIQKHNKTMRVSGLRELCATNATEFREQVCAALALDPDLTAIEIDLSRIPFIDSCGLGALVAVHKAANQNQEDGEGVAMCLVDPAPPVRQLIELTRMDCVFQIPPDSVHNSGDSLPPTAPNSIRSV
jgi:anti-anti-sigma factor